MSLSRLIALIAAALLISGCGFHLRSAAVLPTEMERTFIATDSRHSLFYRALRSRLRAYGIELVDTPGEATAIFNILQDDTGRRVLSVSARNIPREYEVYYHVLYNLQGAEKTLMPAQEQILTRDYTYDERLVLGKAKEEEILREAIANDLARVVLIQLSASRR